MQKILVYDIKSHCNWLLRGKSTKHSKHGANPLKSATERNVKKQVYTEIGIRAEVKQTQKTKNEKPKTWEISNRAETQRSAQSY